VPSSTNANTTTIAVIPFRQLDGRATVLGTYLAEELITNLFNTGNLEIVERTMLDKILSKFHQSGNSSRERGISRAGNRHVRGVAIDLAWIWLRQQPESELTLWFNSRFARGGPRLRKIGIVALARKLGIALWRYADFGEIPRGALLKSLA
jgi:hypothetical protein